MAVVTKIKAIQQWLEQTDGLNRLQATSAEGKPVTPSEILEIADCCEWAELEDMSDTLYAQEGVMHPVGLEVGWGDPVAAYKNGNDRAAGVFFFNAYRH